MVCTVSNEFSCFLVISKEKGNEKSSSTSNDSQLNNEDGARIIFHMGFLGDMI